MNLLNTAVDKVDICQKEYLERIILSITEKCPLECDHCIVDASLKREDSNDINWVKLLNDWNLEYPLKRVSITGGEPFYTSKNLENISKYCLEKNITLGVISSGYWAHSFKKAKKELGKYKGITYLTLSTDSFHQAYVPISYIVNAYKATQELGISCSIKITAENINSIKENISYKILLETISSTEDIIFQKLVPVGRASSLDKTKENSLIRKVCLSTSPVVKSNGKVIPCCNEIISIKHDTLLDMGNVTLDNTIDIISKINRNWFFQYLRLWGLQGLVEEVGENVTLKNKLITLAENDICASCFYICSHASLEKEIINLFSSFKLQLKIALGAKAILEDSSLINQLQFDTKHNETL